VFSAMETDYFPRLSAVNQDVSAINQTINRQIEVSLLIVAPMLASLIISLPVLIPLLFTREFIPVVAMSQIAVFSMYVKAISLPISYLMLAKGDSLGYLVTEAAYDILLVVLVIFGYDHLGLWGTGLALTLSYIVDFTIVYTYVHLRYHYRLSLSVLQYAAMQFPLGIAAYVVTFVDNPFIYWILGIIICFVSVVVSVYVLHQKTSLWTALVAKFKSKFGRHA